MKKKLLAFLMLITSLCLKAQVVANPAPDMVQCNYEVFDLTTQIPAILGNQNTDDYYVFFYLTQQSAEADFSMITNPTAFVPQSQPQVIYARVNKDSTGEFAVTSFSLIVNTGPVLPSFPNVAECGSYILPPVDNGINYFTGPNGSGTLLVPGTAITMSTMIYVRAESVNGCDSESSFWVNIVAPNQIVPVSPMTACDLENGLGYAEFLLAYSAEAFMEANPGTSNITFFLTLEEDGSLSDEISMFSFVNTVPHSQIVYLQYTSACGQGYVPLELIIEQCNEENADLTGVVTLDADNNGCDENDNPAAGILVIYNHSNSLHYTFTNSEGQYFFHNVPEGQSWIYVHNVNGQNFTATPESVAVNVTDNQDAPLVNNFCITAPVPHTDMATYINAAWGAVPGFNTDYYVLAANYGTQVAEGTLTFTFNPALVTPVYTDGGTVGVNTITWNYSGLAPSDMFYKHVTFSIATSPTVNSGTELLYTCVITTLSEDTDSSNNSYEFNQLAVNSYDPNDITVREGESITPEQAVGYLHYTVRFQNTGTAPAQKVRITLPLDENFNLDTFQPTGSSHNYEVYRDGNNVEFVFNNIQLPYEDQDEPGSHGFVSFRIKPVATIALGDSMSETANIYFDFNEPIITNTATTTVENVSAVATAEAKSFVLYPNPAATHVTVKLSNAAEAQLIIADVLGKKVLSQQIYDNQNVNVGHLTNGVYFVSVISGGKTSTGKMVIKK